MRCLTHHLAVELVVLLEDAVDRLDFLEGKERKATRAAGGVAHNGALVNVAKLGKVVSQAVLQLSKSVLFSVSYSKTNRLWSPS